jgi:hypothetical protein
LKTSGNLAVKWPEVGKDSMMLQILRSLANLTIAAPENRIDRPLRKRISEVDAAWRARALLAKS